MYGKLEKKLKVKWACSTQATSFKPGEYNLLQPLEQKITLTMDKFFNLSETDLFPV